MAFSRVKLICFIFIFFYLRVFIVSIMIGFLAWIIGFAPIAKNSIAALLMSWVWKHPFFMPLYSILQSAAALFGNWLSASVLLL